MLDDDSVLTDIGRPDRLTVTGPQPVLNLTGPAVGIVRPLSSRSNGFEALTSLRLKLSGPRGRRLIRYATTSIVALGVSELALLVLYAGGLSPTLAALIGNLVGTLPSYLMSRYWIWPESSRRRVGRQLVLYWLTSFASMAVTSFATGGITRLAPSGHAAHLAIAGTGFLAVSFFTWVAKFLLYQRVIFPVRKTQPAT